jgi:uncharacterized protein YaiI (UPF0178 family)
MKILIDGDACSVIKKTESIAKSNNIEVHIFCDTSRIINSEYSDVHIVDRGHDAADFAIVNHCNPDDIVITSDSGLAAMVLAKCAFVLNSRGVRYTNSNIMTELTRRHLRSAEHRRTNRNQCKGLTYENIQHNDFGKALQKLIDEIQ